MREFLKLVVYFIVSGPIIVSIFLIAIVLGLLATPVLIILYALNKLDYLNEM